MKRMILAVLAAVAMFALSGCGSDNNLPLAATKANITFAAMSSAEAAPGMKAAGAWSNGLEYVVLAGSVPNYVNISTTTAAIPTSGKFSIFPTVLPAGAKKISASALAKAGSFANLSSVSKRTKLFGYFTTDPYQPIKKVQIFMIYSTPSVTPKLVRGNVNDVATLSTSFPAGSPMSAEIIKNMNESVWAQGGILIGYVFAELQSVSILNATPTISSFVLGF